MEMFISKTSYGKTSIGRYASKWQVCSQTTITTGLLTNVPVEFRGKKSEGTNTSSMSPDNDCPAWAMFKLSGQGVREGVYISDLGETNISKVLT